GLRVRVIGRRDRIPKRLIRAIETAESATAACDRMQLNLAIDYSSRDAIRRGELLPPVDLLIRTGGEQRLSDFLLWECAYAELYFTERRWPDFGPHDLAQALAAYHGRERRFGRVPGAPAASWPPSSKLTTRRSSARTAGRTSSSRPGIVRLTGDGHGA